MENTKPALYLSGSMEKSDDPNTWRKKMFKSLHAYYKVIIPNKADIPFDKDDPEYKVWMRNKFVMPDMIEVATSGYVFVKFDPAVFKGAGTISEVTTAAWMGKHIVYWCDGIKEEKMPGWTLGCLADAIKVNSINAAIDLYKKLAIIRKGENK